MPKSIFRNQLTPLQKALMKHDAALQNTSDQLASDRARGQGQLQRMLSRQRGGVRVGGAGGGMAYDKGGGKGGGHYDKGAYGYGGGGGSPLAMLGQAGAGGQAAGSHMWSRGRKIYTNRAGQMAHTGQYTGPGKRYRSSGRGGVANAGEASLHSLGPRVQLVHPKRASMGRRSRRSDTYRTGGGRAPTASPFRSKSSLDSFDAETRRVRRQRDLDAHHNANRRYRQNRRAAHLNDPVNFGR